MAFTTLTVGKVEYRKEVSRENEVRGDIMYGSRGAIMGGGSPLQNIIQYITISTPSDASNFGDMLTEIYYGQGLGDGTRGIAAGGYQATPPAAAALESAIQYITIATPGNAISFGDLITARAISGNCSDGSRGVVGGGSGGTKQTIDYIEINVPANALLFGNLQVARYGLAAVSDGSRAVWGSGVSTTYDSDMDYVAISTPVNALDFNGNRTNGGSYISGTSDGSRGVFNGGETPSATDTIDYFDISVTGVNCTDFGNMLSTGTSAPMTSDGSRGVICGGSFATNPNERMSYINISSPGNAVLFGNLAVTKYGAFCSSGD